MPRILLLIAALGGILLRLMAISRTMYLDELASLEILRQPSWLAAMAFLRSDTHHPGYFTLAYAWSQLSMYTPWLRLLSMVAEVTTLLLIACCLRRQAAIWAIFLWGFAPLGLRFATEIRPYPWLGMGALALILLVAPIGRPTTPTSKSVWLAVVSTWLVFIHPVGIMVVASVFGASWIYTLLETYHQPRAWRHDTQTHLRLWRLALLIAGVCFAALHYGFALYPSGGVRIAWIPPLSATELRKTMNEAFGTDNVAIPLVLGHQAIADDSWIGCGIAVAFMLLGCYARDGRLWVLAALGYFSIFAGYSLIIRPIFGIRPLLPSVLFLTIAAGHGMAQLPRSAALGLLIGWVGWQGVVWHQRAPRSTDPSEEAGRLAIAAAKPHDTLFVAPGFMNLAIDPFLPVGSSLQVATLGQLPLPQPTSGVGLIMQGLLENDLEGHALASWQKLGEHGIELHDIYFFVDKNDDLNPSDRQQRQAIVTQIDAAMGPCQQVDPNARIGHIQCKKRQP